MQAEWPIDRGRERIQQQFRRVEAMPARGIPRAVGAQSIAHTRAEAGDVAVEHVAGACRQRDFFNLAIVGIEQADHDGVGGPGPDGNVHARGARKRPERLGRSLADGAFRHPAISSRYNAA